jgi:acyl carrier protein
MDKFLELMAEILEVEVNEISMETDFRNDIEDWDSMKGFAIICMLEDEYGIQLDVPTFLKCSTISDLYNKLDNI